MFLIVMIKTNNYDSLGGVDGRLALVEANFGSYCGHCLWSSAICSSLWVSFISWSSYTFNYNILSVLPEVQLLRNRRFMHLAKITMLNATWSSGPG
jgi:hypothetical protein